MLNNDSSFIQIDSTRAESRSGDLHLESCHDLNWFLIAVPILQLEQTDGALENSEGTAFAPKTLLPFMKRLPVKRVVHLPNITSDPVGIPSFTCHACSSTLFIHTPYVQILIIIYELVAICCLLILRTHWLVVRE